jgi:hypothetical protein
MPQARSLMRAPRHARPRSHRRPPLAALSLCLSVAGSAGILASVGTTAPCNRTRSPVARAMRASAVVRSVRHGTAAHRRPLPVPVSRGIGRHSRRRRYGPRGPVQPRPVTGDAGHVPIGRGTFRSPSCGRRCNHTRPPLPRPYLPVTRGIGRHSRIRRSHGPMQPHPVTGDAGHVPIGRPRNHTRPATAALPLCLFLAGSAGILTWDDGVLRPRRKLVPRFYLLFTQSLPRPWYNGRAPSEGGATLGTESLPGYYRRLPKVLISSTEDPH